MTDAPRHVSVNGRLEPADGLHVSAFDRAFQLGDGVFETLRAHGGRPTELFEHLMRLRRSAGGLGIELPSDAEGAIAGSVAALLAAEGLDRADGDASIRITVSRGTITARGLLPHGEPPPPTIVVQAWPVSAAPVDHLQRGLHLVTSAVRRDPRSPLAALKTTSRADYVYARLEARAAGADDALFLTVDGHLSEATSANLFLVRAGRLRTPDLGSAILPGTTRDWLLRWAREAGLDPLEARLRPEDLAAADESFLSSSVAGILPVTRFDGQPVGDGSPGPWTRRAREDREAFIRAAPAQEAAAPGESPGREAPARKAVP